MSRCRRVGDITKHLSTELRPGKTETLEQPFLSNLFEGSES